MTGSTGAVMTAVLNIPSGLQPLLNGFNAVELPCCPLGEALSQLDIEFPGVKDRLIDEHGEIHAFINIFVNGDDVAFLQGLYTPLTDGDQVDIVPAIAGG